MSKTTVFKNTSIVILSLLLSLTICTTLDLSTSSLNKENEKTTEVIEENSKNEKLEVSMIFQLGNRRMFFNGEPRRIDERIEKVVPIILEGDRIGLPIRIITELMQGEVDWNSEHEVVTLSLNSKIIKMKIGSTIILVDGVRQRIDSAPIILEGRTMVPLTQITKWFNATSSRWSPSDRTARINWTISQDKNNINVNDEKDYSGNKDFKGEYIRFIQEFDKISVKNSTLFKNLSLPDIATVVLSGGKEVPMKVNWSESYYSPTNSGIQLLVGSFENESLKIENKYRLSPVIIVDVERSEEEIKKREEDLNNNANLASLTLTGDGLNESFDVSTTAHVITIDYAIKNITIMAIAEDPKADIEGSGDFELEVGENTVEFVVTAEDGETVKIYTVVVTRRDEGEEDEEEEGGEGDSNDDGSQ